MRLVRFTNDNQNKVNYGLILENTLHELTTSYQSFSELINDSHSPSNEFFENIQSFPTRELESVNLLPPVESSSDIFCVAANYAAHAKEAGMKTPEDTIIFNKLYPTIIGPNDPIEVSKVSQKMDYEAELAVVIGSPGYQIPAEQAMNHVAGYTILNDITARDLLFVDFGGHDIVDWFSAKCLKNSTPVGPWIVHSNDIHDPHALKIKSWVNGEIRQQESSNLMIRKIPQLIEFISNRCGLKPGDLIATGTPEGVGGFDDIFLNDGDTVRMTVENIGELENEVKFH